MADLKISELNATLSPLVDTDDFVLRRGTENFRVSRLELLKAFFTSNNLDVLYLKGDEFTNGSIRLIVVNGLAEMQERVNDIWQLTSLTLASTTIKLAIDMGIQAVGPYLSTITVQEGTDALVPSTRFDDDGSKSTTAPTLANNLLNQVGQPDFGLDVTITAPLDIFTRTTFPGIRHAVHFKTGNLSATEPVTFQIDTLRGGQFIPFYTREYPVALFASNQDVRVPFDNGVVWKVGEIVRLRISSDADFSMLFNASQTFPYFAVDLQPAFDIDVITASPGTPLPGAITATVEGNLTGGTDRFVSNIDGNMVFDNFGNMVLSEPAPRPHYAPFGQGIIEVAEIPENAGSEIISNPLP